MSDSDNRENYQSNSQQARKQFSFFSEFLRTQMNDDSKSHARDASAFAARDTREDLKGCIWKSYWRIIDYSNGK